MQSMQEAFDVQLLDTARVDLDNIADYHLYEVGVLSAQKITDKILAEQGYRMLVCGKYVCIYKLVGKIVYVYHIVAASSDYPALFYERGI